MEHSAEVKVHISRKKIIPSMPSRQTLPLLAILGGAGIMALALGADLIGVGGGSGLGAKQLVLAGVGFAILSTGLALDVTIGVRYIGEWMKQLIAARQDVGKFILIAVQLGLLVLLIGRYELENRAFSHQMMLLTFYGFLIHHVLPHRYRLSFFFLLSIAGMMRVLGLLNAAWLVGIGLGLIGICHLPLPFVARVVLLLGAGAFLAALRGGWIEAPLFGGIWPILGSMFMFRLIVYLYDLRHQKEKVKISTGSIRRISQTLSYFFLLPNTVFSLFPIVDYRTFCRTYYNDDPYRIYQTGIQWMFRGVTHLILYRFINYYLVMGPEEVTDVSHLLRYAVPNFLLLLRVSGQFHLIIGMLHLFGFNLPEVMHRYFLASSVNEFWRRANIYWKDFMQKVFFYPLYFRLNPLGATPKLVLSTLFVFLATWLLHTYQWFWIRGSFLLSGPDLLFWFSLGILVVANSLYESKYGRKRSLGRRTWTFRERVSQTLCIVGSFTVISFLWTLWLSRSFSEWFSLLSAARLTVAGVVQLIPLFLAGAVVFFAAAIIFDRISRRQTGEGGKAAEPPDFLRSALLTGVSILLLYVIGRPEVYFQFGGKASDRIADVTKNRLSDPDAALLERGYYENLTGVNRFNTQLWELYMKKPDDWEVISTTKIARRMNNFLGLELAPATSLFFHDKKLSTNRWGMRDQDYEKTPPPNTYRIAVFGGSIVMGSGVNDGETFEWLLEERLNRENQGKTDARYEILNLGVGGYGPIQRLIAFENKALSFEPDAVFFVSHPNDQEHVFDLLKWRIREKIEIPYDDLREIAHQADINEQMTDVELKRRLKPFGDEISAWVFHRMVEGCRQRGILPVWILLPSGVGVDNPREAQKLIRLAEAAGFIVLDLSDVFKNQDAASMRVAAWDFHPNARGHRRIAERLYEALGEKQLIPLALSAQTGEH